MNQPKNHLNIAMLIACGFAGAVLVGTLGAVGAHGVEDKLTGLFSGEFSVSDTATATDTGLPKYPGASIDQKDGKQNNAAHINAMLGHSGFQLAVLTELSGDPPGKIADFYRHALTRYGKVVDCARLSEGENDLCNDDHDTDGLYDLRAGEKKDRHIATIEKSPHGSKITLLHIRLKGF